MNYKFVFVGDGDSLSLQSFSDIINMNDVVYIKDIYSSLSPISRFVFKIHVTPRINKIISLPFKELWFRWLMKKYSIEETDDLCFVFSNFWVKSIELGAVDYVKNKYPKAKRVWYLSDLVRTLFTMSGKKPLDVEEMKKDFDLILSFDHEDCRRYNFVYYPLVFSKSAIIADNYPESDIYFLGLAKDRLDKIHDVFKKCHEIGLKCDFHIVGVPKEKQAFKELISYNKKLSYEENLKHIIRTKCLLEIMQGGGVGYTQRVCEAVCYNKFLLTNNSKVKEAPFYRPDVISVFSNESDLDTDFLRGIKCNNTPQNTNENFFSPIKLLEYINTNLPR